MQQTEQLYRIECLQKAPLSSWDDPRTLEEVREQFWDYAVVEGLFDDEEDTRYHIDYDEETGTALMPDWFTISLIEDVWDVRIVKYEEELYGKRV